VVVESLRAGQDRSSLRAGERIVVDQPVRITLKDTFHGHASLIVSHEGEQGEDFPQEK
jgi:hypothetical protein